MPCTGPAFLLTGPGCHRVDVRGSPGLRTVLFARRGVRLLCRKRQRAPVLADARRVVPVCRAGNGSTVFAGDKAGVTALKPATESPAESRAFLFYFLSSASKPSALGAGAQPLEVAVLRR